MSGTARKSLGSDIGTTSTFFCYSESFGMASRPWVVQKFGGSSLAEPARLQTAAGLSSAQRRNAVVVSAFGGVTNSLVSLLSLAVKRDPKYVEALDEIVQRHHKVVIDLFSAKSTKVIELMNALNKDKEDLLALLRAAYLSKHAEDTSSSIIAGIGEIWSSLIFSEYLKITNEKLVIKRLDAREIIFADVDVAGVPKILWDKSRQLMSEWLQEHEHDCDVLVIPGFVASTPQGLPTTLKRNSSDFSAAIIASLLAAEECTIWTDVDGVFSADPRVVKNALLLENLSYKEAIELSYFGAKVLHPSSIQPCMTPKPITMWIRNTFNASCPGTKICDDPNTKKSVKGISTVDGISLLNIEGTGIAGLPDIPHRLFGCLKDINCNTIIVTKGSSEHSVCVGIHQTQLEEAINALNKTFFHEMHSKAMDEVSVIKDCTVLAVVGDGIVGTPGTAGAICNAIGKSNTNIIALSQGSSERNISFVIRTAHVEEISRFVHDHIYPPNPHPPRAYFALFGAGNIGKTLLRQVHAYNQKKPHREDRLEVVAIANSRKQVESNDWARCVDLSNFEEQLEASDIQSSVPRILDILKRCERETGRPVAIVDTTAGDSLTEILAEDILSHDLNFVAANKKPMTGSLETYHRIQSALHEHRRVQCLYEACVGAGLPVLGTLTDMVMCGDKVHKIEGIFSGTLSFIFNEWGKKQGVRFSDVVAKAKSLGYTEPDPRQDLSGQDFARKLICLGRKIGIPVSLENIKIESLVPKELEDVTTPQFMEALPNFDTEMEKLKEKAAKEGKVLCYMGCISAPPGEVPVFTLGIQSLDISHPFAGLAGTDNIISFTTEHYFDNPLVIRGAGAGLNVTAAGLFSDLLKLR